MQTDDNMNTQTHMAVSFHFRQEIRNSSCQRPDSLIPNSCQSDCLQLPLALWCVCVCVIFSVWPTLSHELVSSVSSH